MKTLFVTGATGFIGRNLCPVLAGKWQVRAAHLEGETLPDFPPGIQWQRIGNIGPDTDWNEALQGVDAVVHLAALAHLAQTDNDASADEYFRVNAAGTARLAEALKAQERPARLFFMSSIGAVCSQSDDWVDESTPCRPDTPYGQSKLESENLVADVLAGGPVDWVAFRPPLIYGPANPGNMARLATLTKLPVPLPIGGFKNRRTFLGVRNLTSAIEVALEHPAASRRVFCVADEETVSTPELVRIIAQIMERKVSLWSLPLGLLRLLAGCGDIMRKVAGRSPGWDSYVLDRLSGSLAVDARAFREATGWRPVMPLTDGLREAFSVKHG